MLKCTLGDKTYTIPFVNGRANREADKALKAYSNYIRISQKITQSEALTEEELNTNLTDLVDVMVDWFCGMFRNQFTPDELYDNYPNDQLVPDVVTALLKVTQWISETLEDFPTKPTATATETKTKTKKTGTTESR